MSLPVVPWDEVQGRIRENIEHSDGRFPNNNAKSSYSLNDNFNWPFNHWQLFPFGNVIVS